MVTILLILESMPALAECRDHLLSALFGRGFMYLPFDAWDDELEAFAKLTSKRHSI